MSSNGSGSVVTPESFPLTEQVSTPYWVFSMPLSCCQQSAVMGGHYSCHLELSYVLGNAGSHGNMTKEQQIWRWENPDVQYFKQESHCHPKEKWVAPSWSVNIYAKIFMSRDKHPISTGSNLLHVCGHWWHFHLLGERYSPVQLFWDARVYCSADLMLIAL